MRRILAKLRTGVVTTVLTLVPIGAVVAQPPSPPGRLLASQCAQCHGTDGHSVSDLERLSGADARDMLDELLDMKHSDDTDDIMIRQAKGYSDAQLRLIAEYFATVPRVDEED